VVLGDENTGNNNVAVKVGYGVALNSARLFHFTTNGTGVASLGTFSGSTSASSVAGAILIDRPINIGNSNLSGTGLTISGIVSGCGSVNINNASGRTTLFSAKNTYTGGTTISSGTLAVGASGSLGSGATMIKGGAILSLSNGNSLDDTAVLCFEDSEGSFAQLDIANDQVEIVDSVVFNNKLAIAGTYGATGSGAKFIDDQHFIGTGKLRALNGKPYSTIITIK